MRRFVDRLLSKPTRQLGRLRPAAARCGIGARLARAGSAQRGRTRGRAVAADLAIRGVVEAYAVARGTGGSGGGLDAERVSRATGIIVTGTWRRRFTRIVNHATHQEHDQNRGAGISLRPRTGGGTSQDRSFAAEPIRARLTLRPHPPTPSTTSPPTPPATPPLPPAPRSSNQQPRQPQAQFQLSSG